MVAAELRYGAAKKGSSRLKKQLETVLNAVDVLALEAPADTLYGELRARLERVGQTIVHVYKFSSGSGARRDNIEKAASHIPPDAFSVASHLHSYQREDH
jgi:predicted nucleic acid-binding protein